MVRTLGDRTRAAVVSATLLMVIVCAMVASPAAGATSVPVTINLTLDHPSLRADGQALATLQLGVTDMGGGAVPNAKLKLAAQFITPKSYGSAHLPGSVKLDASGNGSAAITSTRSGTMMLTASIKGAHTGSASIALDARRRSIVMFANGAASTVTCQSPGNCSDSRGFVFNPVQSSLTAQGFAAGDLATFSYAGGVVDPATHQWLPNASTCAQSATAYKVEVDGMRSMLKQLASANLNTDFSVVGLSQGGLLAFQMVGAVPKLPKGSRLENVITLDAPIGGLPLSLIQETDALGFSCWSQNGTSPAARELAAVWDTTAPTQGPQQADRATIMCNVVRASCRAQTNQQAIASAPGVAVYTWGSSDDGVYYPPACKVAGTWPDARDSQIVNGAGGGLHPEGANPGPNCEILSHIAVVGNRAGDIATAIGPQQ